MAAAEQLIQEEEEENPVRREALELLDGILAATAYTRATRQVDGSIDEEMMVRCFVWAADRLSEVNRDAAALIESNAASIAAMRALGERIDRTNRENRRLLADLVNGQSA